MTAVGVISVAWQQISVGKHRAGRTVDVHVAQVRAKLGDASPIRTVRGVGYSAEEPDTE